MLFKKVFLDANIFLDKALANRDFEENSYKIFNYLIQNNIKIYTSCDLITTIYYIISKENKLKALQYIETINQFCNIIEFNNAEVLQSTQLMRSNQKFKDLEDTIQYIIARKEGCDLIISNDKEFASEKIELTTKEFLEKIQ